MKSKAVKTKRKGINIDMNQKEVREIKKRFNPEKDSISRIYGCYVNAAREIVTTFDMSVGLMEPEESELYFKLLKKTLSGTLGKNLLDIEFSTAQVENSDEHRLLQALRSSHLRDEGLRNALYQRIIESLGFGEDSYVILLASDSYDVPFKGCDDEIFEEGSGEVYDYILCCICPVKDAKSALRYFADEHTFRNSSTGHVLSAPELGFLFPAFDDRSTNIYNALYYSRGLVDIHDEFITGVFQTEKVPMSSGDQKTTFSDVLCESLGAECNLNVVRAVHGEIRERLLVHKESKDPEIPEIHVEDVDYILKSNGVSDEKVSVFHDACSREFGDQPILNPVNLMETNKFEMMTPQVKITVDPDYTNMITTDTVNGRTCLIIPVDEGVVVNGIDVSISSTNDKEDTRQLRNKH